MFVDNALINFEALILNNNTFTNNTFIKRFTNSENAIHCESPPWQYGYKRHHVKILVEHIILRNLVTIIDVIFILPDFSIIH